ncbi:MAG: UDP-N-acetylglucosamine 2-epimerase (non-hydrolyzing) [Chloroflexi bacterium]|nr:MAG: UDP-N-acetylglucosamine 2-epimerase (non-hydrolyzing) [Chloroflexota bacterium]
MKILSVFGTRPEAVKMAPIVRLLKQTSGVEARVCVTAQHRQMLDQVLELFQITPDYDLDLMREDQSLAEISASIFTHLDPVLASFQPDWVLVVGDTTTVVTTSLLAYFRRIKLGHVEAGLRTHNKWHPFPEEVNRRIATVIADLHFAPTEWSKGNLLHEGIAEKNILVTGNSVIDALNFVARQVEPQEITALISRLGLEISKPETGRVESRRLVLVTAHRRENFGEPLENICHAIRELAARGDVEIVYPVHLNPKVQEPVNRILKGIAHITLLPPLDYLPMVHLMKHARLLLTDSGGLQEEAPSLGVPVLVLRETTERPEGVEAGTLKLVGTETSHIVREAQRLLDDPSAYAEMSKAANPYGDGHTAEQIIAALMNASHQALP